MIHIPITVSESPSIERFQATWAQIVLALEPLTDTLPEPYKSFFNSPIKLLIGNKISLAIIKPSHMWSYILDVECIYSFIKNIDYIGYDLDYILIKISSLLSRLGLSMSVNGEFLIHGPMSVHTTHQKSELTQTGIIDRAYVEGGRR